MSYISLSNENDDNDVPLTKSELQLYQSFFNPEEASNFFLGCRNSVLKSVKRVSEFENEFNLQYLTLSDKDDFIALQRPSSFKYFLELIFLMGNNAVNNLYCPIYSKLKEISNVTCLDDYIDNDLRSLLKTIHRKLRNSFHDLVMGYVINYSIREKWMRIAIELQADVPGFGYCIHLEDENYSYFGIIADKIKDSKRTILFVDLYEWVMELNDSLRVDDGLYNMIFEDKYNRNKPIRITPIFPINYLIKGGKELLNLKNRPYANDLLAQNKSNTISGICLEVSKDKYNYQELDILQQAIDTIAKASFVALDGGNHSNVIRLAHELVIQIDKLYEQLSLINNDLKRFCWINHEEKTKLRVKSKILIISSSSTTSDNLISRLGSRALLITQGFKRNKSKIKSAEMFSNQFVKLKDEIIANPNVDNSIKILLRDSDNFIKTYSDSSEKTFECPSSILELVHLSELIDKDVIVSGIQDLACDPILNLLHDVFQICIVLGATSFSDGEILGLADYGVKKWILFDNGLGEERNKKGIYRRLLGKINSKVSEENAEKSFSVSGRGRYFAEGNHMRYSKRKYEWTHDMYFDGTSSHY